MEQVNPNNASARARYLEENPDVKNFPMDPWVHWNGWGINEERKWPVPTDDPPAEQKEKYLEDNPDVKNFPMDAWKHWTEWGSNEGRQWPNK